MPSGESRAAGAVYCGFGTTPSARTGGDRRLRPRVSPARAARRLRSGRHVNLDARAAAGDGMDLEPPADGLDPLALRLEADVALGQAPGQGSRVETLAVVDRCALPDDPDATRPCPRRPLGRGYGAVLLALHHLESFSVTESRSGYFHATDASGEYALDLGFPQANGRPSAHALVLQIRADVRRRPTFFSFYVGWLALALAHLAPVGRP